MRESGITWNTASFRFLSLIGLYKTRTFRDLTKAENILGHIKLSFMFYKSFCSISRVVTRSRIEGKSIPVNKPKSFSSRVVKICHFDHNFGRLNGTCSRKERIFVS